MRPDDTRLPHTCYCIAGPRDKAATRRIFRSGSSGQNRVLRYLEGPGRTEAFASRLRLLYLDVHTSHGQSRQSNQNEARMSAKYVFVTGGVVSSLGKGLAAASIGCLLEARGFRVTLQKMDPYINVDAGTMSPYQHGEVFVTDDGGETDLDLGHYERFTSGRVTRDHNITTGKVYFSVIQKERKGDYLGRTVQVIPHITDEIKAQIR